MSSQPSHNNSQASDDGMPTEYTLPTTVASFSDYVPGFEPVVEPTVTVYPIVQQDAGPPIQAPVRVSANQVQAVPTIAPVQPHAPADSGHHDVQMASDHASTTSTDLFLYGGVRRGPVAPDTQPPAANGPPQQHFPVTPRRRAVSTSGIPVLQTFPAGRGRKAASTGSMNAAHIGARGNLLL